MIEEMKDTSNMMEATSDVLQDAEQAALLEFTDQEIKDYEEGTLTNKEKAKFLLLSPLPNAIIKFSLIGIGLIAAILWLVAALAPGFSDALTGFYRGFTGVLATINNILPISMLEIVVILTVLGWLAYLIVILVRFIQVHKDGKLLGYRLWIQFGYSTIALVMVYTMLFSFGYGIAGNRTSFHAATASDDGIALYTNTEPVETELSESLMYYIDKLNTTVITAQEASDQPVIAYSAKTGSSVYNVKGNTTQLLAAAVNEAFQRAAEEIPALKGSDIKAKELLAGPLYNAMNVGSIYSPITGEVLVNPYYPRVSVPMLIAKGIAKQRGFQSDAQADMIAFLVCSRYSDDPYVQYSAYFNAYISVGSKLAMRNATTYATAASALKEDVKKEVIYYTRSVDSVHGNKNSLQFAESSSRSSHESYLEYPKLMVNYYREKLASYADDSEPLKCGYYVNSLVDLYRQDADFQDQVTQTAAKYTEYKIETKEDIITKTQTAS